MNTYKSSTAKSSIPAIQPESNGGPQKNILVPIDFSPESIAALRAAGDAAEKSHAHLTLLNVVEGGTIYRGLEVPGSQRRLQEAHGRRMEELADAELPASITAEVLVGDGDPGCEINRIAALRHIDCIVVGQHQRRRWFGSGDTARKVAGSAPCKVVVLHGGQPVPAFAV